MRRAEVFVNDVLAGELVDTGNGYDFVYDEEYSGLPVSFTMPLERKEFHFDSFPPFFEGLLPEGERLESLLRREKLDRSDFFGQLVIVGADLVGTVTIRKIS